MEDDSSELQGTTLRQPTNRIHFPAGNSRPARTRPDGQANLAGLTPPMRRGSPLNPQNVNPNVDYRRQPWSHDPPGVDLPPRQRRNLSFSYTNSNLRLEPSMNTDGPLEVGAFSDEYELAHEDPRILQDVQRAVDLKARREARMKRETILGPEKVYTDQFSLSGRSNILRNASISGSTASSSRRYFSASFSRHDSMRKGSTSMSTEVDFSPATGGIDSSSAHHPVPCSNDNGKTLDWSSTYSEEIDKRWSIYIGKRKDKDRLPPLGVLMEEQEKLHKSKLDELGHTASPQTLRKADIVGHQLSRRYALVYGSIQVTHKALNLVSISRWHATQLDATKNSLEKAEPFTWLKHLEKRSSRTHRSRWHLSALIMEQYVSTNGLEQIQSIPEDSTVQSSVSSFPRKSRPSYVSSSQGTSSIDVDRFAADDRVSFEPLGELKRTSLDAVSGNSGESAIPSYSSKGAILPISPTSSRSEVPLSLKHLSPPLRPRSPGSSSSSSTKSSTFSKSTDGQPLANSLVVPNLSIHPPSSEFLSDTPLQQNPTTSQGTLHTSGRNRDPPSNTHLVTSFSDTSKFPTQPGSPPPNRSHNKRRRARREEKLSLEYETKASILQEVSSHNHRIRQLLNKISNGMRDYDSLQQTSATGPVISQLALPRDVLDTLFHDPSAVTGSTRRSRGWRAVEDIHQRINRQRTILKFFLSTPMEYRERTACVMDEPIDKVLRELEDLEIYKEEIDRRNGEVADKLLSVETLYKATKDSYNRTASRVSVQYPELSNIIALEESYRDQYQQVWDFGLDALTLLLDTVTPVWRTYGKAIGEDVRDFLIIPLYRNEFTGEVKTYPIKGFPRRSIRHWFGLCLFLLLSVVVNILQARAALTSTLNFRLQSIPYDGVRWTVLPLFWVAICIQWSAVVCEFVVVLLQLGVILWWAGWSIRLVT